jgi:hypothetical protein
VATKGYENTLLLVRTIGNIIQYIYISSNHTNPICRVAALPRERNAAENIVYDKEKSLREGHPTKSIGCFISSHEE